LYGCSCFDAKSRKIRHVALPVDDVDVANKRYVATERENFERSIGQNRKKDCNAPK